jgi:3-oxo-5-alpha-steroid 4-dehydrogenase 1
MTAGVPWSLLIAVWFALAAVTFAALSFVAAPYGRHAHVGWGPRIPDRAGWIIMEAPAALVFVAWFCLGRGWRSASSVIFLGLWEAHYVHRAFVYPLLRRGVGRRMPVAVVGLGFVFNVVNSYWNGRYLFADASTGYANWIRDPRFLLGLVLFASGLVINRRADQVLRGLRQPGESGYVIPRGGLYRWISCPNYLGEIVEWAGWAVMTWSLPGLAFAVWTTANLAPRARTHHRWYREQFADYPSERRALIPGLW